VAGFRLAQQAPRLRKIAITNHQSLITKKREPVFEDYLAGAQVMSIFPFGKSRA